MDGRLNLKMELGFKGDNAGLNSSFFASELKVRASADCGNGSNCIDGQQIAVAANGIAVFDATVFNGLNGTYNLTFKPDTAGDAVEVPFSIRECRPGEELVKSAVIYTQHGELIVSGFVCKSCTPNTFSFLPMVP